MLRVLCHVSFVSFLSLLCVDVRVLCSHAWYHVYDYALLGSMCSYAFCHVLCLDPHPHMLICLDSCSSMFMWLDLRFHMFVYLNLGFHMLVCLNLCSAWFMPSSMCLCPPCHICVPRPRLCLSCHVLLQPFCRFTFLAYVLAMWLGPDLDPVVFIIVHIPWPTSKGLDHPFCMCLLLCFIFHVSLSSSRLYHVWHP